MTRTSTRTRPHTHKAPLAHFASLVYDTPLAIIPEKLETILHAIGPRLTVDDAALAELLESGALRTHSDAHTDELLTAAPERVAARYSTYADPDADPNSDKPYALTSSGIAIIPITGTLMKRGGWMASLSGCSSYESISAALSAAMDDPSVRGVLFDVDSPGGTTHGCFELADAIHGYRGSKPMFAIANDLAASAAYALASSADRLFLTRTAGVGSIGVFALHCDQSALDEKMGVKYTYVHFGDKKVDGNPHEPLARSARKDIQSEVDREGDMFVATVARNRGTTLEKIAATQAAVQFADAAIPLLADEVGTFDDALAALELKVNGSVNGVTDPRFTPGMLDTTPVRESTILTGQHSPGPLSATVDSGTNAHAQTETGKQVEVAGEQLSPVATGVAGMPLSASMQSEMSPEQIASYRSHLTEIAAQAAHTNNSELASQTLSALAALDAVTVKVEGDTQMKKLDAEDPNANAVQQTATGALAAPAACDKSEKAKAKGAPPAEPDGDEPDPDEEEKEKEAKDKKGKKADDANSAAVEIIELCSLVGLSASAASKYIAAGKTPAQVRHILQERRSVASEADPVSESVGDPNGGAAHLNGSGAVDNALTQARALAASTGVPPSKALETVLAQNPQLYRAYNEERMNAAHASLDGSLTSAGSNYINQHQARYMRALGLGTAVGVAPPR